VGRRYEITSKRTNQEQKARSCEYREARQDAEMTPQTFRRRSLAVGCAREFIAPVGGAPAVAERSTDIKCGLSRQLTRCLGVMAFAFAKDRRERDRRRAPTARGLSHWECRKATSFHETETEKFCGFGKRCANCTSLTSCTINSSNWLCESGADESEDSFITKVRAISSTKLKKKEITG